MTTAISASSQAGGCVCGEVRYLLQGQPLFLHACHCRDCQQLTGSAFVLTMIVDSADFRVIRGKPEALQFCGSSRKPKTAHRCPTCGCNLFGTTQRRPGCLSLRPGTLDDNQWFAPQAHIWTRSKQAWLTLPHDTPCYATHYDTGKTWPASSIDRLQAIYAREGRDGWPL